MKQFKNILLFGGTKDNGEFALQRAAQLAQENKAKLTVLDVVKPVPTAMRLFSSSIEPDELQEFVRSQRREELMELCSKHVPSGVSFDATVTVGQPVVEIVRMVLKDGCDLLLKTADGGGILRRSIFGSIGMQLLRKCPCPVWIIRPDRTSEFDRIVAAVDVESESAGENGLNDLILQLASSLAELEESELHVVQAWELWMEQALRNRDRFHQSEIEDASRKYEESTRRAFDHLLNQHGLSNNNAKIHLLNGAPGIVISELVRHVKADLLVMGTVCRTGVPGFLIGNTAERILNDVDASVLAVKPDGYVSPIALGG